MMKKRILSMLLAAVMLLSLLPATALAAGTETNTYEHSMDPEFWIQDSSYVQLSELCKNDANSDHTPIIYYGTDLSGEPMPYYLIGSNYDADAYGGNYITLLAKNCVSESYFDNLRTTKSGDYVGSALQTATDAMVSHLSDYEKAIVLKRTVSASAYSASAPYSNGVATTELTEPIFRPLTTAEAEKLDESIRNICEDYWLCSPGAEANTAAYVDDSGNVVVAGGTVDGAQRGVRPVLILDSAEIFLYVNYAVGGKDEKTFLQDTAGKNNNEWKLTIYDKFSINCESAGIEIKSTSNDHDLYSYTFNLENCPTGGHAVLYMQNAPYHMDAGVINGTENQKISFMVPPFYKASDALSFGYELWNGDKKTDVLLARNDWSTHCSPRRHAELQYNELYLRPGDKMDMKIEHEWNNAEGSTVTLESSNPAVATATVLQQGAREYGYGLGEVNAVGVGEATITATFSNGLTDTCHVTVANPSNVDYSVTGISTVKEFEDFALQTRLGDCKYYEDPGVDEDGCYISGTTKNPHEANYYVGKTVELKADIGSESNRVTVGLGDFYGVLEGNGHNIWLDISNRDFAGICARNFGMICNLTAYGSVARVGFEPSEHYCGAFAAQNFGTIYNCTNRATVTWINWNCREDTANIYISESYIGGIVGSNAGLVDGCVNAGNVVVPYGQYSYVGGIAGGQMDVSALIKNCVNASEVRINTWTIESCRGGICGFASGYGSIHNSINMQPDVYLCYNYRDELTNAIQNCYSPMQTSQETSSDFYHAGILHSQATGHGGEEEYTYVSPEMVSARSGKDALITLLNNYTDPNTGKRPQDWMKWAFQGNDNYPTPVIGSEENTNTVFYLDENGNKCIADAKILSKDTVDTVLYDAGSPVYVVEGDVDLNDLIHPNMLENSNAFKYMNDCILILEDESRLVLPNGIRNQSWPILSGMTVYAQSTGENMGELVLGGEENYRAGYEGNYLTINGGKVTLSSQYPCAVCAYALNINGGEVTINTFGDAVPLANKNPGLLLPGKMPNFESCHITMPANYSVKTAKDGDAITLDGKATWEERISPVMPEDYSGPSLYPASVWIGATSAPVSGVSADYIDKNGDVRVATGVTVINEDFEDTELAPGWYVVKGEVTLKNKLTITGDVHLILPKNAQMTVMGGIDGGSHSLYVHGQEQGGGALALIGEDGKNDGDNGSAGFKGDKLVACGCIISGNGGEGSGTGNGGCFAEADVELYNASMSDVSGGGGASGGAAIKGNLTVNNSDSREVKLNGGISHTASKGGNAVEGNVTILNGTAGLFGGKGQSESGKILTGTISFGNSGEKGKNIRVSTDSDKYDKWDGVTPLNSYPYIDCEVHGHNFAKSWDITKEGHYHYCEGVSCFLEPEDYLSGKTECAEQIAYAPHDTKGANGTCSVCGYNPEHDLKVSKNGKPAVEGTDYVWVGTYLVPMQSGLTVSGTTKTESIAISGESTAPKKMSLQAVRAAVVAGNIAHAFELTLKDVSIEGTHNHDENISGAITVNGGKGMLKLILEGDNYLGKQVKYTKSTVASDYIDGSVNMDGEMGLCFSGDGNLNICSKTNGILNRGGVMTEQFFTGKIKIETFGAVAVNTAVSATKLSENSALDVRGGEMEIISHAGEGVRGEVIFRNGALTIRSDRKTVSKIQSNAGSLLVGLKADGADAVKPKGAVLDDLMEGSGKYASNIRYMKFSTSGFLLGNDSAEKGEKSRPANPKWNDYEFDGWYTNPVSGKLIWKDGKFVNGYTEFPAGYAYAHWKNSAGHTVLTAPVKITSESVLAINGFDTIDAKTIQKEYGLSLTCDAAAKTATFTMDNADIFYASGNNTSNSVSAVELSLDSIFGQWDCSETNKGKLTIVTEGTSHVTCEAQARNTVFAFSIKDDRPEYDAVDFVGPGILKVDNTKSDSTRQIFGLFSEKGINIWGGTILVTADGENADQIESVRGISVNGILNVNGGTVRAQSGKSNVETVGLAANTLNIYGGDVTAIGGEGMLSAGAVGRDSFVVDGTNGSLTAKGGFAAIASTSDGQTFYNYIKLGSKAHPVTLTNAKAGANPTTVSPISVSDGTNTYGAVVSDKSNKNVEIVMQKVAIRVVRYLDENGNEQEISAKVVDATTTELDDGWWVVTDKNLLLENGLKVSGNAKLILADGAALTVKNGIDGTNGNLCVYGQSNGTGKLIAEGKDGTGSNSGGDAIALQEMRIYGGNIVATGGEGGTDAAGGNGISAVGSVNVMNGSILATGGKGGSGATAGKSGDGISAASLVINGGKVDAFGGDGAQSGTTPVGGNGISGDVFVNGGCLNTKGGTASGGTAGKGVNGTVTVDGTIIDPAASSEQNYKSRVGMDVDNPNGEAISKENFADYATGKVKWNGFTSAGIADDQGVKVTSYDQMSAGEHYRVLWKNNAGNQVLTEPVTVKADGVYLGKSETPASAETLKRYGITYNPSATPAKLTFDHTDLYTPAGEIGQSGRHAGIIIEDCDLVLDIRGESNIQVTGYTDTDRDDVVSGISVASGKSLTVSGNAPLHISVTGGNTAEKVSGILADDATLCIKGRLDVTATNAKDEASALNSGNIIFSDKAFVNAKADGANKANAIVSDVSNGGSGITVEGSAIVNANGGEGKSEFYGICTNGDVTVKDNAKLNLTGGSGPNGENTALKLTSDSGKTLKVSGNAQMIANGTVEVSGTDSTMKMEGKAAVSVLGELKAKLTADGCDVVGSYEAGSVLKQENAETPVVINMAKRTVTFKDASGTPVSAGGLLEKPEEDPVKSGYIFGGWYKDPACTEAWNFDTDVPMEDMTLYPKWIAESEKTVTIKNAAISGNDGKNAKVELISGTQVVASAMTDDSGEFSFDAVKPGDYMLVVTKDGKTTSELVRVNAAAKPSLTVSDQNVSTKIDDPEGMGVMVGGLNTMIAEQTLGAGERLEIFASVKEAPESSIDTAQRKFAQITQKEEETKCIHVDILAKHIGGTKDGVVEQFRETKSVLEIIVPFKTEGRKDFRVMRYHDGIANLFTLCASRPGNDYKDGTYFVGNGFIVIYADKFSEYAITYTVDDSDEEESSSTGGRANVVTYALEPAANIKNGKLTVSPKNASAGQTVTVTVTPDKGYTLETLTVLDQSGKEIAVKSLGNNKYSFKMPSGEVKISATFMEDNEMLNFFVDVKAEDYFYDAVLWAAEKEITKGTDDVHFSPMDPVTRGQVVTFLWRAAGKPVVNYAMNMADVASGAYYTEAVRWALAEGITKGTDATHFDPDAVCTRGQIVAFLARFAGVKDTNTESVFSDVNASDYFAAAVKWAKDNKVTEGTSATTFGPNEDCTRGQVVTFLYRWMVK